MAKSSGKIVNFSNRKFKRYQIIQGVRLPLRWPCTLTVQAVRKAFILQYK